MMAEGRKILGVLIALYRRLPDALEQCVQLLFDLAKLIGIGALAIVVVNETKPDALDMAALVFMGAAAVLILPKLLRLVYRIDDLLENYGISRWAAIPVLFALSLFVLYVFCESFCLVSQAAIIAIDHIDNMIVVAERAS